MQAYARLAVGVATLVALGWGCSGENVAPPAPSPAGTAAQRNDAVKIRQFGDLPTYPPYYFPTTLSVGPDGALWVADDIDQDAGESAVVRISSSGKSTQTFYYQNYASPAFVDMTAGPDGALWLADEGDGAIVRMTTGGTFTVFPLNDASPEAIVSGPGHALWFVENYFNGAAVGRIRTDGAITYFTAGLTAKALQDIALGPDGALWFTEPAANSVGRITARGKITEFSTGITPGAEPYSIVSGPDGALWFTERDGERIGRITTHGKVSEYSQGISPGEGPVDLAAGTDGALWFTEYVSDSYLVRDSKIGRITTSGQINEYVVARHSEPTTIVQGPHRDIWFVETRANRLGRIDI